MALEVQAEDRYSLQGKTLRSTPMIDEALGLKLFILSMFCHALTLSYQLQPLGPRHPVQTGDKGCLYVSSSVVGG